MRKKNNQVKRKIIQYVDAVFEETGMPPTMQEISEKLGISKSTVSRYVAEMSEQEEIEFNGKWHGIKTKQMQSIKPFLSIPIVGNVSCGVPLLEEPYIEDYLSLSRDLLGNGDFFILRASGDSMINAGIDNGDLIVLRKQCVANNGQIVLALVDDSENTLKRFYYRDGKVTLHPENEKYKDIESTNVVIQGVAVKIIKDLK